MTNAQPIKTRRIGTAYGLSLYTVEQREAPPTFDRGDGHDSGRNLLSAVLIGPSWGTIGYVLGSRGNWYAYTVRDWREQTRRYRRSAPLSQWSTQLTVAAAAEAVRLMSAHRKPVAA